jgi:ubiquinol-cytochrome c reductase iron-sulfur subunit
MKLSRRGFSLACLGMAGASCASCHVSAIEPSTTLRVDPHEIVVGSSRTFDCGSRQIVVRHRTEAEIAVVRTLECDGCLQYPQPDGQRSLQPAWIVLEPRCTHLGCNLIEGGGRFGGWLCPCHGSEFDPSGRVTRGPADANLRIPPHRWVGDRLLLLPACEVRSVGT